MYVRTPAVSTAVIVISFGVAASLVELRGARFCRTLKILRWRSEKSWVKGNGANFAAQNQKGETVR